MLFWDSYGVFGWAIIIFTWETGVFSNFATGDFPQINPCKGRSHWLAYVDCFFFLSPSPFLSLSLRHAFNSKDATAASFEEISAEPVKPSQSNDKAFLEPSEPSEPRSRKTYRPILVDNSTSNGQMTPLLHLTMMKPPATAPAPRHPWVPPLRAAMPGSIRCRWCRRRPDSLDSCRVPRERIGCSTRSSSRSSPGTCRERSKW